jgi:hypothetical protein
MNPIGPGSATTPDPPNDSLLRVENLEVVGPDEGAVRVTVSPSPAPPRRRVQKPTAGTTATAFKLSKACYR